MEVIGDVPEVAREVPSFVGLEGEERELEAEQLPALPPALPLGEAAQGPHGGVLEEGVRGLGRGPGHEDPQVLADQLLRGVAEHVLGRRVHLLDDVAVADRDQRLEHVLHHRPHPLVASPKGPIGLVPLEELPELPAQGGEHLEPLRLRLLRAPGEELHDPPHLAPHHDREAHRRAQAVLGGRGPAQEARIPGHVGDPFGPPALPDASRQLDPSREDAAGGRGEERDRRIGGHVPGARESHHGRVALDAPEGPAGPAQGATDRLEDLRPRVVDGEALGQDAGHRVLGGAPPLGPAGGGDVPDDRDEGVAVALAHLRDHEIDGEPAAVGPPSLGLGMEAVLQASDRAGHQHLDAPADHARRRIPEETLGRAIVDLDGPAFAVGHEAVRHVLHDRPHLGLARGQGTRHGAPQRILGPGHLGQGAVQLAHLAPDLELGDRLPAERAQGLPLPGLEPAWCRVHDGQRAQDVAPVVRDEGEARVEADPGPRRDQRIRGEARVGRRILDHEKIASRRGEGDERRVGGRRRGLEPDASRAPPGLAVGEADEGDGGGADAGREAGQIVESGFGGRVEHVVTRFDAVRPLVSPDASRARPGAD